MVAIEDIRAAYERLGMTQAAFAVAIGLRPDVLNKILAGARQLRPDEAERIIAYVRDREFARAVFLAPAPPAGALADYGSGPANAGGADVPLYGSVAAGEDGAAHLNNSGLIGYTQPHPAQWRKKRAFALIVVADSMDPRYRAGETVYCVHDQPPQRGQDVVVEMLNGDAFLKEYVGRDRAHIITRQINPAKERLFSRGDVKALHAVVGRG